MTTSEEIVPKHARTIAVTGGKGGVGKSIVAIGIAINAAAQGLKVAVLDADWGLAKLHIMMGALPLKDMGDVLQGRNYIEDILIEGPMGVHLYPGASGLSNLDAFNSQQKTHIIESLHELTEKYDLLLIDTGAGIGTGVLPFLSAVDEIIVVSTPEPTAASDAYSVIQSVRSQRADQAIYVVMNAVHKDDKPDEAASRLNEISNKYLNTQLSYVGYLPYDTNIRASVVAQTPYCIYAPESLASQAIRKITHHLIAPSASLIAPKTKQFSQRLMTERMRRTPLDKFLALFNRKK